MKIPAVILLVSIGFLILLIYCLTLTFRLKKLFFKVIFTVILTCMIMVVAIYLSGSAKIVLTWVLRAGFRIIAMLLKQ